MNIDECYKIIIYRDAGFFWYNTKQDKSIKNQIWIKLTASDLKTSQSKVDIQIIRDSFKFAAN